MWGCYYRHKLYLVGYRVTHGGWVLLNGEYPERVSGCLRVSFPAFNKHGNLSKSIQLFLNCLCLLVFFKKNCSFSLIAVEPIQVNLGTSYSSLERNSVGRKYLKLNRQAFIDAVNVLKHASLGMPFEKEICARHILSLIQMIPEAVRIEEMSGHIRRYYLSNDNETRRLPPSSIKMQKSWTKASRAVARWTFGMDFGTFWLSGVPLDVEEVIKKFPYIKGITLPELECD